MSVGRRRPSLPMADEGIDDVMTWQFVILADRTTAYTWVPL